MTCVWSTTRIVLLICCSLFRLLVSPAFLPLQRLVFLSFLFGPFPVQHSAHALTRRRAAGAVTRADSTKSSDNLVLSARVTNDNPLYAVQQRPLPVRKLMHITSILFGVGFILFHHVMRISLAVFASASGCPHFLDFSGPRIYMSNKPSDVVEILQLFCRLCTLNRVTESTSRSL